MRLIEFVSQHNDRYAPEAIPDRFVIVLQMKKPGGGMKWDGYWSEAPQGNMLPLTSHSAINYLLQDMNAYPEFMTTELSAAQTFDTMNDAIEAAQARYSLLRHILWIAVLKINSVDRVIDHVMVAQKKALHF